jgi:hypothetical protein
MSADVDAAGALERLPADARQRLEQFAAALERVHVDDLPLYTARLREPVHRRAAEAAAVAAAEHGLTDVVEAARAALIESILREFAGAQLRVSYLGVNSVPGLGSTDDRVRMMQSLGDAVAGIVLWDRLEPHDRDELLGLWSRLLP